MVIDERECRKETIAEVARQIMIAGRTAPKGKGIDLIEIVAVTGETIEALAEATRLASEQTGMKFFLRDAETSVRPTPSFWSERACNPCRSIAVTAVIRPARKRTAIRPLPAR